MLRRVFGAIGAATLIVGLSAGIAFAGNPAGTGQPRAECGEDGATMMPHGFTTDGFAKAELRYAGGDDSHASSNSHAVSQYDVACYQITQHH